jgi:alkaline phosphatase D
MNLSRRGFFEVSGAGLIAASTEWPLNAAPSLASTPFTLGVASGDPLPDRVVIWTRLAPTPLVASRDAGLEGGGMPPERVPVRWEVASDDKLQQVVRSGVATTSPDAAHTVHVDVEGLRPATWYWYRFRVGSWESPIGRTRTAPAAGVVAERLRLGFASCQRWEQGHFTALSHLADEGVDLIVHLGDYIYEYGTPERAVRPLVGREITTIGDYRARYALYRSDPDLQASHAAAPFVVTWDDHEVDNDYADEHAEDKAPVEGFLRRRAAAYQAYYEHMPLRRANTPRGPDMPLYRRLDYGRLVQTLVLDTRQYRTPQPCGASRAALCDGARDPRATILGEAQERWLLQRLDRSGAVWNVLAQQVMISHIDLSAGPATEYPMDKWAGYQADTKTLLEFLARRRPSNPIVLTGDIHSNWVCDVKQDMLRPESPTVATELVGTSISSGGDGQPIPERVAAFLPDNPHVRYFNGQRGYVSCTVTPKEWRADYRIVPFVTKPGAPVSTHASFIVENGRPGAQRL